MGKQHLAVHIPYPPAVVREDFSNSWQLRLHEAAVRNRSGKLHSAQSGLHAVVVRLQILRGDGPLAVALAQLKLHKLDAMATVARVSPSGRAQVVWPPSKNAANFSALLQMGGTLSDCTLPILEAAKDWVRIDLPLSAFPDLEAVHQLEERLIERCTLIGKVDGHEVDPSKAIVSFYLAKCHPRVVLIALESLVLSTSTSYAFLSRSADPDEDFRPLRAAGSLNTT